MRGERATSVYVADMEEVRAMLWLLAVHVFFAVVSKRIGGVDCISSHPVR